MGLRVSYRELNVTYDGPPVTLENLTYHTLSGDGRGTTIYNVAYLGVIARKSDGFTTLSVRKPGSSKAFNIETGRVVSIGLYGRVWQPEAHYSRWALRAAEIRAFVERTELEEWARPYFDPRHEKHHLNRSRNEADELRLGPETGVETPDGGAAGMRLYDPSSFDDIYLDRPGFIRRLWRHLFGGG